MSSAPRPCRRRGLWPWLIALGVSLAQPEVARGQPADPPAGAPAAPPASEAAPPTAEDADEPTAAKEAPSEEAADEASEETAEVRDPDEDERDQPPLGEGWEQASRGGLRYALDAIEVEGNTRTSDRVVLRYVPFEAGDLLDVADPELELLRYRLLGTGFFKSVQVSLRKGETRGSAVLVIEVVERNTLIIEHVAMGIAADEDADGNSEPISPFLGLSAAETNLAGTGMTLGAGFAVAADQFSLRSHFTYPHIGDSAWMITSHLHFIDAQDFFGNKGVSYESPLLQRRVTDYAVVGYTRFGGSVGAGLDLSLPLRLLFDYQLERVEATVPYVASHIRGETREPIDFDILPGASVLSMIHASLVYDSRDSPFLPERGTFARFAGTFGLPPLGSSYGFAKLEGRYQRWWRLPWRHVVSFEGQAGAILGDAPFFEQFYVGDFSDLLPDRVLGLSPDRRQPPNLFGTDIVEVRYGDFAARLQGEYRIPLYRGRGAIYGIDVFGATGVYAVATKEDLRDPPSGYTGAAQVPIDLTYNLGLRFETYVGGFSFAFANLVGLLPPKRGDRK